MKNQLWSIIPCAAILVCAICGCYRQDEFDLDATERSQVFSDVDLERPTMANGSSHGQIVIWLDQDANSSFDKVKFEWDGGVFPDAEDETPGELEVPFTLHFPCETLMENCEPCSECDTCCIRKRAVANFNAGFSPGTYTLKATMGNYSREWEIALENVPAEDYVVSTNTNYLHVDSAYQTVVITTTLLSENGTPSNGFEMLDVEVYRADGTTEYLGGTLSEQIYESVSGICQATFSLIPQPLDFQPQNMEALIIKPKFDSLTTTHEEHVKVYLLIGD